MKIKKELITIDTSQIIPYPNNPRINDAAVKDVVESIKQCENLNPIEIDENNIILSGHTRLKALQQLNITQTQVIRYTGLTDQQKKKYRLLANKTAEKSSWDYPKLSQELSDVDFLGYDFEFQIFDQHVDLTEFESDRPKQERTRKTVICPHCGEEIEV